MNYGLPYKGSKSKIANKIIDILPSNNTFVDLFAGGCAITHAAILSGKYKTFIANDIQGMFPKYFLDCMQGKASKENRVVTKEEFAQLKDTDPYVACCYSFGSDCRTYLWGKEKEYAKIIASKMLLSNSIKERYRYYKSFIRQIFNSDILKTHRFDLQGIECLNRLQGLGNLNRIQSLQGLKNNLYDNISVSSMSYEEVSIPDNSTIYCDIPYKGTNKYSAEIKGGGFDYDRFYDWCRTSKLPIYVSEYQMPSDFVPILEIKHSSPMCATNNNKKTIEKVFIHESKIDATKMIF